MNTQDRKTKPFSLEELDDASPELAVDRALELLTDEDPDVRSAAVQMLYRLIWPKLSPCLATSISACVIWH